MSGKSRSQKVILSVIGPRIPHLPAGDYSCYVDDVRIVKGSVKVTMRIVDTISDMIYNPCERREKDG